MPQNIRELLVDNLEVNRNDVYVLDSPLGLSSLWQLYSHVERHDLKDAPYKPRIPKPEGYVEPPKREHTERRDHQGPRDGNRGNRENRSHDRRRDNDR